MASDVGEPRGRGLAAATSTSAGFRTVAKWRVSTPAMARASRCVPPSQETTAVGLGPGQLRTFSGHGRPSGSLATWRAASSWASRAFFVGKQTTAVDFAASMWSAWSPQNSASYHARNWSRLGA